MNTTMESNAGNLPASMAWGNRGYVQDNARALRDYEETHGLTSACAPEDNIRFFTGGSELEVGASHDLKVAGGLNLRKR